MSALNDSKSTWNLVISDVVVAQLFLLPNDGCGGGVEDVLVLRGSELRGSKLRDIDGLGSRRAAELIDVSGDRKSERTHSMLPRVRLRPLVVVSET